MSVACTVHFRSEMYCISHGRDSPAGGCTGLRARKSSVCRFSLAFYRILFSNSQSRFFVFHFRVIPPLSPIFFSSMPYFIYLSVVPFPLLVSLSSRFPLPFHHLFFVLFFSAKKRLRRWTGSSTRNLLRDDKQQHPRTFLSFYLLRFTLSLPRSEFSHYRFKMTE